MYDTDETMRKLWISLLGDFRVSLGWPTFCDRQSAALHTSIKSFRTLEWPARSQAPVYVFKTVYQLENLFKRYRFRDDAYTDQELVEMFEEKFISTQLRLGNPIDRTPVVHSVLKMARRKCREILGKYSENEHLQLCRFGKRACKGIPYRESYLDVKMSKITGSIEHLEWFRKKLLPADPILSRICEGSEYIQCSTLVLTGVPKSHKALRGIMPNTVAGSVFTAGLGDLLAGKLRDAGLDIRHLQKKHGVLAKQYSITRECVTADLSAASDSLSIELLRWVLPARWFHVIMYGRIPHVEIGERSLRMQTVVTMGLGQTFPLQTLIFYCLLWAIGELKGASTHKVSVYGDDLIYPRTMHPIVVHVFDKLNLILNKDKTYVRDNFRESCGSDYYRGCDVRPYQPKGRCRSLTRRAYGAFLYGIYNGLRRRWDRDEIPQTLDWILNELYLTQKEVFQVPHSFPEESGIQTDSILDDTRFVRPEWNAISFKWCFPYLRAVSRQRFVPFQDPYYWERLRPKNGLTEDVFQWDDEADTPVLMWRKTRYNKWVRITSGRIRALEPYVSRKGSSELQVQSGVIPHWN